VALTPDEKSLDDCIGQLLCPLLRNNEINEAFDYALDVQKAGSVFIQTQPAETILALKARIRERAPDLLVAADLVYGAGSQIIGASIFPQHLAMGACGDPAKIRELARITAREARYYGINWTLAPLVDLLINPDNPCLNTRAFGENPGQVAALGEAFIEGCQEKGLLAACAKHFPGDGIDDRDQHLCTSINSLSRSEWMQTYGLVWKAMIASQVDSIMIGHIGLPWLDPGKDWRGPPPATISRPIITDLLRNELGYEGVVVSDAMVMAGINAFVHRDRNAVEFIKAGGDVVLFSGPQDHRFIREAVENGEIDEQQVRQSAARVLRLKHKLGLLSKDSAAFDTPPSADELDAAQGLSRGIASGAIKVLRNEKQILPLSLEPESKVAVVNIGYESHKPGHDTQVFASLLSDMGYAVEAFWNPGPGDIKNLDQAAAIFLNIFVTGQNKPLGTTRLNGATMSWSFRTFLAEAVPVIVTSFGCPYKLKEFPSAHTFINAFSSGAESQGAALDVIFGKAKAQGKHPVSLRGFFDCEY
jgi:beta-N-acetylhexosaminidase